jgi:hypothetical protein
MAEATNQRDGNRATDQVSTRVRYRDLPEPAGLRKYLGASVIITATALGSGELIVWVMR